MADAEPPKINLTPHNILGIIQRDLMELHAYLNRPPHEVDLDGVMAHLNNIAGWVNRLPPRNTYMAPEATGAEKRAAN